MSAKQFESAANSLKVVREYSREAEQIYQYYSNIYETFKAVLSKNRIDTIYLTIIRDFLQNNKSNWERIQR